MLCFNIVHILEKEAQELKLLLYHPKFGHKATADNVSNANMKLLQLQFSAVCETSQQLLLALQSKSILSCCVCAAGDVYSTWTHSRHFYQRATIFTVHFQNECVVCAGTQPVERALGILQRRTMMNS